MKYFAICAVLTCFVLTLCGCRGGNSTYTTAPATVPNTTSATEDENDQTQTPTIDNGNGPITTAATDGITPSIPEESKTATEGTSAAPKDNAAAKNSTDIGTAASEKSK